MVTLYNKYGAFLLLLCVFTFYSSLIPHCFLSLGSPVCLSLQSHLHLVVTPMIIPSSFARILVMPDVVISSPLTFQPLTCALILSNNQASLLLTQSRNNLFGLTLKVFSTPYLARKLFKEPHPLIICCFLVFKNTKGKTQGHKTGCLHLGQPVISSCQCPLHLAYSTVDSYNTVLFEFT